MLNRICFNIKNNKNILMLISTGIYVLSLIAIFSNKIFLITFLITLLFLFLLIKNYFPIKYIMVWTLLFYFGVINLSSKLKNVDELLNLAPVNSEICGTIVSIPQNVVDSKPKFFFDVEKIKFGNVEKFFKNEKVLVTMNNLDTVESLKIYNSGILKGRLSTPFKAGNPSQFDYGNYLRNHNAYTVFYADSFVEIKKPLSISARILQKINDYREYVLKVHSKYLPSPNLELLGGIVFGDDAISPPKNIKTSFANSGLLHILAASGMNVAFIFGFFFWIFSRLNINYKLNVAIGMIMVTIYSLMTGLGASIIRATCMLLFVLLGKLIDRDAHSISLLSFVGLLMLIYNPLFINDVGFQLSFIVTFGILIMSPAIIKFNNKISNHIIGIIAIPIIAQLWVIPIQIFYFSNICLYSIFANIMSVPILSIISFGGFVSSLLAMIKPISSFICQIFDFILNPIISILINISDFWGHLPNSTIQTAHPTIFQIIIYYLMLLTFTALLYKDWREKFLEKTLVTAGILLIIWLVTLMPISNKNLEIIAFDVGNADAFLIKTPKNEYMIIDTGKAGYNGGKTQAEMIILKYLKDRGIKNIDTMIVSHFDNDHSGGAYDIIDKINVNKVYVNDIKHDSLMAKLIYKKAKEKNTDLIISENNQIIYENKDLKIINFFKNLGDNDNENSILTLLEYKNFSMLFTGDISAEKLLKALDEFPQNITVLKVPHHGASDGLNREIINYLKPKYSLISVGDNYFGHPNAYILSLLKNSKVLRTDIHNSIKIVINDKGYKFLTYDTKKRKYVEFE